MKKSFKRLILIMLALVMAIGMLAGCGQKGPTADDAKGYVKAVLDLMCTGDYDHSVDLTDVAEGTENDIRESIIDEMMTELSAQSNLSEEVANGFRQFMSEALTKTKYTVTDAVATDDGGFDVTVSIEPLIIFAGVEDELTSVIQEKAVEDADKIAAMSEDERTNYVMEILIELLNKKIADPQYDPAEDVTVHYGLIEGESGSYGCSEADGEKLGAKLFSQSGL